MSFDDMASAHAGEQHEFGINFASLIASTLHQIRILASQEKIRGIMFHSYVRTDEYGDQFIPMRYQPNVFCSYNNTVKYLASLLQPYANNKFTERLSIHNKKLAEIERLADEKLAARRADTSQDATNNANQTSYTYGSAALRKKHEYIYREQHPIYEDMFLDCIVLLKYLGLLPRQIKKQKMETGEDVV